MSFGTFPLQGRSADSPVKHLYVVLDVNVTNIDLSSGTVQLFFARGCLIAPQIHSSS